MNHLGFPGPNNYLVSKGAQFCQAASYGLYTSASTQNLVFSVFDGVNGVQSPDTGPPGVWDGNWHFVAGTYDGAYVRLYVDGVEVHGADVVFQVLRFSGRDYHTAHGRAPQHPREGHPGRARVVPFGDFFQHIDDFVTVFLIERYELTRQRGA